MPLGLQAGLGPLALALLSAAAAPAQEVRVSVRTPTPGPVACALRDGAGAPAGGRLAGLAAGRWAWMRLPGDVLSCTGAGFEPLDVDPGRGALPAEIALEMLAARAVTLEAASLETLVEWRALPVAAGPTVLLARQSVRIQDRLTLPVATRARVLRLRPPGASPISLFVPEGTAPLTLRLPPPLPGGELFGLLPAHAFAPVALELLGSRSSITVEPTAARVFGASGLAPGAWTVVPRYRGGLRGKAQPLVIQPGQSLERLPLDLPDVGALTLAAAPEVCARENLPARLSLQRLEDKGAVPVLDVVVNEAPCDRELEGLDEGSYEARLYHPGERPDVVAASRGHVFRGERLALPLQAPEVRVSGRLTFGEDRPAAGMALTFDLEEHSWTAPTDEQGEYELSLGAAGEYSIAVRSASGLPSASFVRNFQPGVQRADFKMADTAITVRVGRFDGAPVGEAVQLALTTRTGRRLNASWDPAAESDVLFAGLEFGEYWVTATTASGLASRSAEPVELSAQEPLAEVEVMLDRHQGLLKVVDEGGLPLAAEVVAGDRPLTPHANGSYRLGGIAMGERLRILFPGYVPVCRRLKPTDLPELRVVLPRPTDRLTLHFSTEAAWGTGQLMGLPGSDCPIELTELEFAEQTGSDSTMLVLRVPRGRFQLAMGSATYAVSPGTVAYIREPPPNPENPGRIP